MKEIFDPDGHLYQWLLKVYQIIALHVIFVVAALPLVTIGAAATALYGTWFRIWSHTDDGKLVATFADQFRRNLKPATAIWLTMAAIAAVLIWVVYPYVVFPAVAAVPLLAFLVMLVVAVIALGAGYIFPVLARFENSAVRTVRNAFLLALANLAISILVFVVHTAVAVGFIYSGRFVVVWLVSAFGVTSWATSWLLAKVFRKYTPEVAAA